MHGPYRLGDTRWWLRDDLRFDDLRPGLETMLASLARGELVDRKSGRRKALFELQLATPEPAAHLLKQNAHRGWAGARRRMTGSKSRLELDRAERLAGRGLPTPVPLAAGERTRGGLLETCWLLMRRVPDAVDLRAWWEGPPLLPRQRRWLARALGALARSAVDSGLFQDDFAPNNVLLQPGAEGRLMMIDFERARVLERLSTAQIRRMLAKLDREMRGATKADRMRFLTAFAGDRARSWWHELAAEARVLMARDLAHLERSLASGDRRYLRVEEDERRGWVRADAAPGSLAVAADPAAMTTSFGPTSDREARRLLATAILLFRRGLGPSPRGLVITSTSSTFVWDLPACAPAGPAARRVLLERLSGLGLVDWRGESDVAGQVGPLGVERGLWMAPQRFTAEARKGPRLPL